MSGSKYDCCTVAPSKESMMDPSNPQVSEYINIRMTYEILSTLVLVSLKSIPEIKSNRRVEIPIISPPIALQKNPVPVTPPLVPEGTDFHVVINLGDDLLKIPNSLANVSAKHVA